jgi:hypothetical protein
LRSNKLIAVIFFLPAAGRPLGGPFAIERCKIADSFNAAGLFKGVELLGKHLGMFQGENQGVTVNLPFDGWVIERAE